MRSVSRTALRGKPQLSQQGHHRKAIAAVES